MKEKTFRTKVYNLQTVDTHYPVLPYMAEGSVDVKMRFNRVQILYDINFTFIIREAFYSDRFQEDSH